MKKRYFINNGGEIYVTDKDMKRGTWCNMLKDDYIPCTISLSESNRNYILIKFKELTKDEAFLEMV